MILVAMAEDRPEERTRLKECLKYVESTEGVLFEVREFTTGLEFIGQYEPGYDIVFMDIEMPGMNGMDAARALRKIDSEVLLIFVTNLAQYAISGYEVDALDFILKPINKFSFAIKMKRALSRLTVQKDDFIRVKTDGETKNVRVAGIRYVDVDGHYVVYHTAEGDVTEYSTLKEAVAKIDKNYFVNVHRSCVVNLHYVSSVAKDEVVVGDERLAISRPQKKAFLQAMSEFMGGKK